MDINKTNTCILLTACVKPSKDALGVKLMDPQERLRQYIQAVNFYVRNSLVNRIIICDNSNYRPDDDILNGIDDCGKKIEWIHFQGDAEKCKEKGKGYGEGEIIDYAMRHSRLVEESENIIKITGRLIVENINSILWASSSRYNYVDIYVTSNRNTFADTRFFMYRKKDYGRLLSSCYYKVDERRGIIFECCVAESFDKDNTVRCLPIFPVFVGRQGGSGFVYSTSRYIMFCQAYARFKGRITRHNNRVGNIKLLDSTIVWPDEVWNPSFTVLENKRIIIYGVGTRAKRFYNLCKHRCSVVAITDSADKKRIVDYGIVSRLCVLGMINYDYIVVVVKRLEEYKKIIKLLDDRGVKKEKIIWLFDLLDNSNLYY